MLHAWIEKKKVCARAFKTSAKIILSINCACRSFHFICSFAVNSFRSPIRSAQAGKYWNVQLKTRLNCNFPDSYSASLQRCFLGNGYEFIVSARTQRGRSHAMALATIWLETVVLSQTVNKSQLNRLTGSYSIQFRSLFHSINRPRLISFTFSRIHIGVSYKHLFTSINMYDIAAWRLLWENSTLSHLSLSLCLLRLG